MKKKSFLHNLDPRAKLFFSIVYTICALLFTEIIPLLIIFMSNSGRKSDGVNRPTAYEAYQGG